MDDLVRAWHFCGDTLRDRRPIPADGEWLIHDGPVKMCVSGLHASRHPFDALQYAPGPILGLVECADIVQEDKDKLVCCRRRIVHRLDVTDELRYFAQMQALSVVHLWDAPQIVLDYLMTGDESIRDAARAAARAAAWAAAWAAARDAAGNAAWDAAWAAAWAAAWDAALDAAWAAEGNAALDAARSDFAALVNEAFGTEESDRG